MAAGVVKSMGSVPWGITILNFELAFVRETGQAIISIFGSEGKAGSSRGGQRYSFTASQQCIVIVAIA